jgi:hypothetical protein
MPFVRRDFDPRSPADKRPDDGPTSRIADLSSLDAERRWTAARALGRHPEAVPALAAALGSEPSPRVREAIVTALLRIGDEASVKALLPYLRSQDASQRMAVIEALQALPGAILPFMELQPIAWCRSTTSQWRLPVSGSCGPDRMPAITPSWIPRRTPSLQRDLTKRSSG